MRGGKGASTTKPQSHKGHKEFSGKATPPGVWLGMDNDRIVEHARLPSATNAVSADVVDVAIRLHRELGPGLLENVYEVCLAQDLEQRGLGVERQVILPVIRRGVRLDAGFRVDLIVARSVIVELKSTTELLPVHRAQLLTYLKLSGLRLGLLINFNVPMLRLGIQRVIL